MMLRNLVSRKKKEYAKRMRKNPMPAEKELWKHLRKKQTGVKFKRQQVLRGYIADFYSPQAKLVVEVDGSSHKGKKEYDERRDGHLALIGFLTLRFSNGEVMNKTRRVVDKISIVANERAERYKKI